MMEIQTRTVQSWASPPIGPGPGPPSRPVICSLTSPRGPCGSSSGSAAGTASSQDAGPRRGRAVGRRRRGGRRSAPLADRRGPRPQRHLIAALILRDRAVGDARGREPVASGEQQREPCVADDTDPARASTLRGCQARTASNSSQLPQRATIGVWPPWQCAAFNSRAAGTHSLVRAIARATVAGIVGLMRIDVYASSATPAGSSRSRPPRCRTSRRAWPRSRALDDLRMARVAMLTSVLGRPLVDPVFALIFDEPDRRAAVLFLHPMGIPPGHP